jgi:hypothetical protein
MQGARPFVVRSRTGKREMARVFVANSAQRWIGLSEGDANDGGKAASF